MRNKNEKLLLQILKDVYCESEPKADIDELLSLGEPVNFNNYYCPDEIQKRIVEKYLKGKQKDTRKFIEFNFYLGCSPLSTRKIYNIECVNQYEIFSCNHVKYYDTYSNIKYDSPKEGRLPVFVKTEKGHIELIEKAIKSIEGFFIGCSEYRLILEDSKEYIVKQIKDERV